MARTVQLLLTETVDNLGIVGDVVNVKLGYARNYLLPRGWATQPSDELLKDLAEKRADAEKRLSALRKQREETIGKLDGIDLTLTRACNDMGLLYGSVTQQDISDALGELGFGVKAREVRLSGSIKRVDAYEVLIKFDSDLEANIKIHVVPDRTIEEDDREEMEFDNEGNLIQNKPKAAEAPAEAAPEGEAAAAAE
ncbi:MAG: 50S ribosomal protein L9 [Planctomycetota bacterium]